MMQGENMNIEKLFTSLEGAYAPNTIKAYRSEFEHLTRWSQQNKLNPLSLSGTNFVQCSKTAHATHTRGYAQTTNSL
jgi:site-specific recombinase XerD